MWEMKPKQKYLVIAFLVVAGVGTIFATNHWYYQRYIWPAEIQKELFGRQIVDANLLPVRIADSGYGEGMFRWTYRIDPASADFREYCGSTPVKSCRFQRTKHLKEGVDLSASYANGVLTIEEWWS